MGFLRVALTATALLLAVLPCSAQDSVAADDAAERLAASGFTNVRVAETRNFVAFSIENDAYKLQSDGIAAAVDIIEEAGLLADKPVKLVLTEYDLPRVTLEWWPELGRWVSSSRTDSSWDLLRLQKKLNSSFGKVDVTVYPQLSLKNLIITQVYQSLWNLNPAVEFGLWPGSRFSYQLVVPVYNDGYGLYASKVHPGMITLAQHFRDPWNLGIFGKATVGTFSNGRYGAAFEMKYYLPDEHFSVDGELGYVNLYYFDGFIFHFDYKGFDLLWKAGVNWYWAANQTTFSLHAQKFLMGDKGLKFEMVRHFHHASVGFYAEKAKYGHTNGGFRFQIVLPPYKLKRRGYIPRINTSTSMGMTYNANNEQHYYKEFRSEYRDNILTNNSFNPVYLESAANREK